MCNYSLPCPNNTSLLMWFDITLWILKCIYILIGIDISHKLPASDLANLLHVYTSDTPHISCTASGWLINFMYTLLIQLTLVVHHLAGLIYYMYTLLIQFTLVVQHLAGLIYYIYTLLIHLTLVVQHLTGLIYYIYTLLKHLILVL